jgi:hypothetical protein
MSAGLTALGCDKRQPTPAPEVRSSAGPLAAAAPSGAWHYAIEPGAVARVDMPGLKEDIQGEATSARGSLEIVAADLARSTGEVSFDLSTFATHTFHSDKDATQTEHAQTWLEVKVGGKIDEEMRWVRLTIRSIESTSVPSLALAPATNDGGGEVRVVTMKVRGDLHLHGRNLPQEAVVDVSFSGFYEGEGGRPRRVEVRSREPMHLVLKDYDVRPRDPAGQLVAWTTQLVSKVAETADVTVNLGAVAAPSMRE